MSGTTIAYAAPEAKARLERTSIQRRPTQANDIRIRIGYCGICHTDIHQVRDDWGSSTYPMVPGHEITGIVTEVGSAVTRHSVGDRVGVGCFVDSCRTCDQCRAGEEQYCRRGPVMTYNATDADGSTTYGGYSTDIVVDEHYVVRIPDSLGLDVAAPLLCAGITTYSPLVRHGVGSGTRVAVVGLGGLGHLAVRVANALGADVIALSRTDRKRADALRLGARHFHATYDHAVFSELAGSFDLVLNTVSAAIDLDAYLGLLDTDGTMVNLGAPADPSSINMFSLLMGRRSLAGSQLGGIAETQRMLDFCAAKSIGAEIEKITADAVNEAFDRVSAGDVRFRFVLDMGSLSD